MKKFVPSYAKKKVSLHGRGIGGLNQSIPSKSLPKELGGTIERLPDFYSRLSSEHGIKELRRLGYNARTPVGPEGSLSSRKRI